MRLAIDVDDALVKRIDEEAERENISRLLWISLAITQKLTTRGLSVPSGISPEEPHQKPEELLVLREQVGSLRQILRAKDDEITWLRWEITKLNDRLGAISHESFWECLSRYSRTSGAPVER